MIATDELRPESERIEFLLRRDGFATTREWVAQTLAIYRKAMADPTHYASIPFYRPRFERAVREFEEWLAGQNS